LGLAFLSQQPYFKNKVSDFTFPLLKKADAYVANASDWVKQNVYPKISGGVAKSNDTIESAKKGIEKQKNNFVQNSVDSAKKFIAKEMLSALGVKAQDLDDACKAK